jgi:hypothetical protein
MIILKIRERGLYLEIPGLKATRTPVEVDITKCNLSLISVYLRKQGITDYEIYSKSDDKHEKEEINIEEIEIPSVDKQSINKRFSKLENMMSRLLQKEQGNDSSNSEQINRKLETLERIALKLLEKDPLVVQGSTEEVKIKKKIAEPEIEELEETFIPSIDTSKMKMKGSSSKTKTTSNKMDIDDSVDLLSRIIGQED